MHFTALKLKADGKVRYTMFLYGKKTTCFVAGGLLFLHLLCIGLSGFFIYRFLIVSYDPSVFILLAILIGGLVVVDITTHQVQVFGRLLVRCKFTMEGIICYGIGMGKWCIQWEKICFYGITGYSLPYNMPIVFLSADPKEKYDEKNVSRLTKQRVVFELRQEILGMLQLYMPADMIKRMEAAIDSKRDMFFRKQR